MVLNFLIKMEDHWSHVPVVTNSTEISPAMVHQSGGGKHFPMPPEPLSHGEKRRTYYHERPSSSSSEESDDHRHRYEKKRTANTPFTTPAKAKYPRLSSDDQMAADAALVPPQPVIAFLQTRVTPKACGHCIECKKTPCGSCKACVQNSKPGRNKRDRRRCERLRCKRNADESSLTEMPFAATLPGRSSVPTTLHELTTELNQVCASLASVSATRTQRGFKQSEFDGLLARKSVLYAAQVTARNRQQRRKFRKPVGFGDAWGVVAAMEKDRIKFAKFAVKQAHSEDSKTIDTKRKMRDELDRMIMQFVSMFSEQLAPLDETDKFWFLISKNRDYIPEITADTEIHIMDDEDDTA